MKKQQISALILCLFLLMTFCPNTVVNAVNNDVGLSNEGSAMLLNADTVIQGTAGANITWTLDSEGTLTFSGTGEMNDYEYSTPPWTEGEYDVHTVLIGSGITSIGRYAFYNCDTLESVTISESVRVIGDSAFYGCISIESVIIPGNVQVIGDSAFGDCRVLANITISEGVLAICDSAFLGCASESIIIPGSVQTIGNNAFRGCPIEILVIYKGVHTIGAAAFFPCHRLCNIYYSGSKEEWDAIIMDYPTFYLTEATYHYNSTGSKVTWQYRDGVLIFSGEGEMPDYKNDVTPAWFKYEDNVKTVLIESGITAIGRYAFYNCDTLESVTIPKSVQKIGDYAFSGCAALCDIYYCDSEDNWERIDIGLDNSNLTDAVIHYNSEPPATEPLIGDLNNSGTIDTGDASMILRVVIGLVNLTDEQKALGDVNKTGSVDTGDAVAILRIAVNMIDEP